MKKRNILRNIAKVMAGSLLAVTVFAAISPAMASFADENDGTTSESAAGETTETESRRPFPLPLPDGTNSTSITVTMRLPDNTKVSGDTLKVYRIAGVTVDDHGYKLEYIDSFTSLEDKYPLSTYEVEDPDSVLKDGLAGDAAALVDDQTPTAGDPQIVTDGKAVFKYEADEKEHSELGLFLVIQKMSPENEKQFKPIDPFLVTIPYYDENDEIYYDVQAKPKLELDKIIEELTPCKADPPVRKIVEIEGEGTPKEGTFWFFFERGNDAYPMPNYDDPATPSKPVDENKAELSLTTSSMADGEFGWIEFTKAGEYTYTLTEDETRLPDDYKAKYPGYKYTIHYHVDIAEDDEGKVTGLEVSSIVVETSDNRTFTLEGANDYKDVKAAQPDASKFPFYNTYKIPDPPSTEPSSSQPETETTRKRSETTPHERVTPPPSVPAETPTVAGATRTPEPEGDVLGAARTPQAVLGASRLPQTGQLWWPVPILAVAGIALMAGGLVKRRSDE